MILDALEPEERYAIFFLMCHGMRPGELRALKHKDIDLKKNQIIVRRSFSRTSLRDTTKSKNCRPIKSKTRSAI